MSSISAAEATVANGNSSLCCASSTFSCVNDLGHKPINLYSCHETSISKQSQQQPGRKRKRCLWFSKDYGEPIFAMHSNGYLNSECFIMDTEISVIPILPTYKLLLFKEYIHAVEDEDTKFSIEFKDGSDSFAVWIQLCSFQNVEPFTTTSVKLTKPSSLVPLENRLLRSSTGPTPASSWLTMKFKAPAISGNKSSNWFIFARMQLLSITFKKWSYVVLLLKSDDPDDDAPPGLFCIRPGVTCLKTGSQLYYEPCDGTRRKYILDFDHEPLCDHVWNFAKLVTPRDYAFYNEHLKMEMMDNLSEKGKKLRTTHEAKRNRRLGMFYRCFGQIRQEVKQIMKSSRKSLQEIIDMPEIHINKLFFSQPVWIERYTNVNKASVRFSMANLRKEVKTFSLLQSVHAKLHVDIVKMLMKESVPAELIAEYRELLVRMDMSRVGDRSGSRCSRIHCLFI